MARRGRGEGARVANGVRHGSAGAMAGLGFGIGDAGRHVANALMELAGLRQNRKRYIEEQKYRTGQDAMAAARYKDERAYRTGRDEMLDQRYTDERAYRTGRDEMLDQRFGDQATSGALTRAINALGGLDTSGQRGAAVDIMSKGPYLRGLTDEFSALANVPTPPAAAERMSPSAAYGIAEKTFQPKRNPMGDISESPPPGLIADAAAMIHRHGGFAPADSIGALDDHYGWSGGSSVPDDSLIRRLATLGEGSSEPVSGPAPVTATTPEEYADTLVTAYGNVAAAVAAFEAKLAQQPGQRTPEREAVLAVLKARLPRGGGM